MVKLKKVSLAFREPPNKTAYYCRKIPRNVWLLMIVGLFVLRVLKREQSSLSLFLVAQDESQQRHQSEFEKPQGITVAYAISVTFCHPDDFMADAAAVLKHSIHLVSRQNQNRTLSPLEQAGRHLADDERHATTSTSSRYDYQMYAFVHPEAQNCTASLHQLGFKVLVRDVPVAVEEIRNADLRHDVTTTGCCHEREFLKLYALTLTQHPIVVHLDLDVVLLQPLDDLFDAMMLPDSQAYYQEQFSDTTTTTTTTTTASTTPSTTPILKYIPHAMWTPTKKIPITSYFTRDYNMDKQQTQDQTPPHRINMQGGFWIVKPHWAVFEEMVDIIKDGHNYTRHYGWGGPAMPGKSYYYGVAQVQGLVSYYYSFVRPGSSVELNKCIYNNMVDRPRPICQQQQQQQQQQDQDESAMMMMMMKGPCQDCRQTPLSQVRSLHLTLCQKPWWCPLWMDEPLCSQFHYQWHWIRQDWEQHYNTNNKNRGRRKQPSLSTLAAVNTSDMQQVIGAFPHHCFRQGSKGYQPIQFSFLRDDSF